MNVYRRVLSDWGLHENLVNEVTKHIKIRAPKENLLAGLPDEIEDKEYYDQLIYYVPICPRSPKGENGIYVINLKKY